MARRRAAPLSPDIPSAGAPPGASNPLEPHDAGAARSAPVTTGSVVLDASTALSWVLLDEASELILHLRDLAMEQQDMRLLAPATFPYEVANALWVAVRRGRLAAQQAMRALEAIDAFGIELWHPDPRACIELALNQGIAVYDAAYAVLARDGRHALWTLDRTLARVARGQGFAVAPQDIE